MYHPRQGREEQRTHRPEQGQFTRTALPLLTVVFWVAASICVVMIAVYAFTQSMGAWLSWMTGISLLVVVVCSGALACVEVRSNPKEDAGVASGRTRCCSMASSSPSRSLWPSYTG
jgi:hypothetical protein